MDQQGEKTTPAPPGEKDTADRDLATSRAPDQDGKRKPEADRQDEADNESDAPKQSVLKAHPWLVAGGAILLILLIVGAVAYWLYARNYESTDDAFIDARTVSMSAQVSGMVTDVPVTDNQVVEAGTLLARIDDRDYAASAAQATAQIDQARAGVANFAAQIEAQKSQIDQMQRSVTEAKAALTFAQDENTRYQDLVQRGSGTAQRAQQAASDLTQKQAATASAIAAEQGAQKQLDVLAAQKANAEAQVESALAQKQQADANLSRTAITAPVRGRVTRLTGAKGGYATPGQALMMLVPLDVWVTANFKETQLDLMRPGQKVQVKIDAYGGRAFAGHVDSIQAGSGTAFSLLPAENATGNYVKVVQRVPVKIVFDLPPDVPLGPGMSVVPSVTVR